MGSLRDIRRRINSVKSTRQITKAMKMVSAAKLRRAQNKMTEARPYASKMEDVLRSLVAGVDRETHPLLAEREAANSLVLVITGDRGLCSSFNTNALKGGDRLVTRLRGDGKTVMASAIGKKARRHIRKKDYEVQNEWEGLSGKVEFSVASEIAKTAIAAFVDEKVDEVYLVFNEFKSVTVQNVVAKQLLPIESSASEDSADNTEFLFEPSILGILDQLLPKYVEVQVFQALLESQAAEEAARMAAMENATQAATDMIGALTLEFNKARQATITAELMDIIGGAEAVKQ